MFFLRSFLFVNSSFFFHPVLLSANLPTPPTLTCSSCVRARCPLFILVSCSLYILSLSSVLVCSLCGLHQSCGLSSYCSWREIFSTLVSDLFVNKYLFVYILNFLLFSGLCHIKPHRERKKKNKSITHSTHPKNHWDKQNTQIMSKAASITKSL